MDIILAIPLYIIGGAFGGWLGRKYQRHAWLLDRPYAERVAALKLDQR